MITITTATLDDVDQLVPLFDQYRAFYQQDSDNSESFLRARLENSDSTIFLAYDDDRAVGFTQLYPSYCSVGMIKILILYDLFVHESARNRGVGRLLLQHASELAQQTDARRIDLMAAKNNKTAQNLYESFGYCLDREFHMYSLSL